MRKGPILAWEFFKADKERHEGEPLSEEDAKQAWSKLSLTQREPFLNQGKCEMARSARQRVH
jgi:hypothetical protein